MAVEYGRPLCKTLEIGGGRSRKSIKGHIRCGQRVKYQDQDVWEAAVSFEAFSANQLEQWGSECSEPGCANIL